ncbi:hypothetical protein [Streptomyces caatingaensis]|uniref:Membrane protein n=1 Tax=Streptomyces caatingaensis TaxID=1678637 RepID=A0A0K9X9T8_9ACTN|nr:hypothetical protein [Streptomyces caatingaensis]KNB50154.1 membrane protein [Streptomyces caatingaensis]
MSFGQGDPQGPHGGQGPQGPQAPQPWGPPQGPAGTPDWAALADDAAARGRRRRLLLIGGGVLAAAGVAAIVATAIVASDKDTGGTKKTATGPAPASGTPASPEPTFAPVAPPAPLDPRDFISEAGKDKAPLTPATLFPEAKPAVGGRVYERTATSATADCAAVTQGGLGSVLAGNGCRRVLRATYVRDGVAVTVGVAVFDTKAAADRAKDRSTGNIEALNGGGSPEFCRATACRLTANAEGRYAYFTVAGYTGNKPVTAEDTKALTAGRDISTYAFGRVLARGRAAAAAAAAETPAR